MTIRTLLAPVAALALASPLAAQQGKRPLTADDIYNVREVRDPQRSPDGKWVAYTVARSIRDTDKNDTDIWMVSWDGREQIQVTSTPAGESAPRWSPDGKYLAFLSSRQGSKRAQVWLMNRAGGEAVKITDVKGSVSEFAWSPDSRQMALVVKDPDPRNPEPDAEAEKRPDGSTKTPKPIVIDRYYFKADGDGYLRGERSHLYLFDLATKKADLLTPGSFDEESPSWSPDGKRIAFIRRHADGDVDRAPNRDLFVMEACTCASPTRLTFTPAEELGILPGIGRSRIMELTGVQEARVELSALAGRSMFFVNAVRGIVEISRLLGEPVPRDLRTAELSSAFWPG